MGVYHQHAEDEREEGQAGYQHGTSEKNEKNPHRGAGLSQHRCRSMPIVQSLPYAIVDSNPGSAWRESSRVCCTTIGTQDSNTRVFPMDCMSTILRH
jgi:hypothetical protein